MVWRELWNHPLLLLVIRQAVVVHCPRRKKLILNESHSPRPTWDILLVLIYGETSMEIQIDVFFAAVALQPCLDTHTGSGSTQKASPRQPQGQKYKKTWWCVTMLVSKKYILNFVSSLNFKAHNNSHQNSSRLSIFLVYIRKDYETSVYAFTVFCLDYFTCFFDETELQYIP